MSGGSERDELTVQTAGRDVRTAGPVPQSGREDAELRRGTLMRVPGGGTRYYTVGTPT